MGADTAVANIRVQEIIKSLYKVTSEAFIVRIICNNEKQLEKKMDHSI